MGKLIQLILCLLLCVNELWAQVTPGTVNSKTLDGVGNKITSQVVGVDRPLHVYCLGGTCGGGVGTTDVNVIQLLGVAPGVTNPFPQRLSTGIAFYDARDRNWTLVSGTDSISAVQSGVWNINNISGIISLPTGAATEATLLTRLADATFIGRFTAAFLSADAIANQTTTAIHGFGYMFNGVTWDRMRGTIAGGLLVNVSTFPSDTVGTTETLSAACSDAAIDACPANSTASVSLSGKYGAGFQVNAGTLTATIRADLSYDGGSTWIQTRMINPDGGGSQLTITLTNPNPVTQRGIDIHGGATHTRLRVRTFTSGSATGVVRATFVLGTELSVAEDGVLVPEYGTQIGASDGTNLRFLRGSMLNPVGTEFGLITRVIPNGNVISTANNDGACSSGAASFTVVASNVNRTWLAIWASPANTDDVFIKLGAIATSSDGRFAPGQSLNITSGRIYTGVVDAFPASGTQAVCLMELN